MLDESALGLVFVDDFDEVTVSVELSGRVGLGFHLLQQQGVLEVLRRICHCFKVPFENQFELDALAQVGRTCKPFGVDDFEVLCDSLQNGGHHCIHYVFEDQRVHGLEFSHLEEGGFQADALHLDRIQAVLALDYTQVEP